MVQTVDNTELIISCLVCSPQTMLFLIFDCFVVLIQRTSRGFVDSGPDVVYLLRWIPVPPSVLSLPVHTVDVTVSQMLRTICCSQSALTSLPDCRVALSLIVGLAMSTKLPISG